MGPPACPAGLFVGAPAPVAEPALICGFAEVGVAWTGCRVRAVETCVHHKAMCPAPGGRLYGNINDGPSIAAQPCMGCAIGAAPCVGHLAARPVAFVQVIVRPLLVGVVGGQRGGSVGRFKFFREYGSRGHGGTSLRYG